MSDYQCCCDRCFGFLAKHKLSAANLWLKLCISQKNADDGLFFTSDENDDVDLEILEKNGLIVTCDVNENIIIKLNKISMEGEEPFFCGGHDGK